MGAAVIVSETLSLSDFQTVFDALMGGALAIMRGEIRVDFGQGVTERIPFEARFDRMNGDVFEPEVTAGAAPGQFNVLLRNAIESPSVWTGSRPRCSPDPKSSRHPGPCRPRFP